MTMISIGSELAVLFSFFIEEISFGPWACGPFQFAPHTIVNTTIFQSQVFFLYSRVEFASSCLLIGQIFFQLCLRCFQACLVLSNAWQGAPC